MRTLHEIVEEIWQNRDTSSNVGGLAKRLQRFDKALTGEAREALAAWIPEGELGRFARDLPKALRQDCAATMKLLRDEEFQEALPRGYAATMSVGYTHRIIWRGHTARCAKTHLDGYQRHTKRVVAVAQRASSSESSCQPEAS